MALCERAAASEACSHRRSGPRRCPTARRGCAWPRWRATTPPSCAGPPAALAVRVRQRSSAAVDPVAARQRVFDYARVDARAHAVRVGPVRDRHRHRGRQDGRGVGDRGDAGGARRARVGLQAGRHRPGRPGRRCGADHDRLRCAACSSQAPWEVAPYRFGPPAVPSPGRARRPVSGSTRYRLLAAGPPRRGRRRRARRGGRRRPAGPAVRDYLVRDLAADLGMPGRDRGASRARDDQPHADDGRVRARSGPGGARASC